VLQQIGASKYASLWKSVWGEPLRYNTSANIELNYDRVGLAIAAYEASSEVNQFSSKFDRYMAGDVSLTPLEASGMMLFNGKGLCNACHPGPLFTDFTFDNLGVPRNPQNPFYDMDVVYLDNGTPINPAGDSWVDIGLGGYLESLPETFFTNLGLDKGTTVAANMGKHKVPTLRNVDLRPGKSSPKAYMHNGVFKSLKEVVHFYNTRDVETWPEPEVMANANTAELGDLGLTDAEEDAIVAFLATLSDGYKVKATPHKVSVASAPLRVDGPNPFNPSTRLSYGLSEPGLVSIHVYDLSGRLVQTLAQGWQVQGQHFVEWNARGLASGQYVVRMDAGGSTTTQRLTLLK